PCSLRSPARTSSGEPDLRSGRNILLYQIAWQHDRHTTRAAILWLHQLNRSDMRIEYTPVGSTELNLIFCPNLEIGTGRYHRGDHTTSSRNVEHVFNLEKK